MKVIVAPSVCLAVLVRLALCVGESRAATLVVPTASQNVDGQAAAGDLRHTVHIQTVYGAANFPAGQIMIQELRYRPSALAGPFTSSVPSLQINLSTSPANPNALSTTFANNRGANDTLVFQGAITLSSQFLGPPGGPMAFDISIPLTTPFLYDRAAGNLVVEVRNFQTNAINGIDASGSTTDGSGRMFAVSPTATTGAADMGANVLQLIYNLPSTPPTITTQPQNANVAVGSPASFSVVASGSFPLAYQWRFNEGDMPGETNATLSLPNVTLAQQGPYRVLVTNQFGQALSSQAQLTAFTQSPFITTQPQSQRVPLGAGVSFSVVAGGSPTLAYQWTHNGMNLTGANGASLTLNNVTAAQFGTYRVFITSPYGQILSDPASLDLYEILAAPILRETPGPSSRRTHLAISEIMYHPAARADGRNLEFIELHNAGAIPQNLSGFRITGDVDFTFPSGAVLAADARLVVAASVADVQAAYGIANVVGPFTNVLSNGEGLVRLRNKWGAVLLEVNYSEDRPWPLAADGAGHSLVLARPSFGEGQPEAWAESAVVGGSPGVPEPPLGDARTNVLLNEIHAHATEPAQNFLELFNHGRVGVNLWGCVLTDDPTTNKFRIAASTPVIAGGFFAIAQTDLGFALDPSGGKLFLINSNGTRVLDALRYGPQALDVSWGRSPNGSACFSELATTTPGTSNAPPFVRPIVINEIMFHSVSGDDDDQFIELKNRSASSVNVGGWRLDGGVSFTFAPGTTIPANGYLVVANKAARLLTNYPDLNAGNLAGDFGGSLSGRGERIALTMPQTILSTNPMSLAITTNRSHIVVNEVNYRTGGRWGRWADGGGASLELIDPDSDNRLAANWADSAPPAMGPWTTIEYTGPHEFGDGNSPLNGLEIGLLGQGECLVDDVEVIPSGGVNRVTNPGFSSGASGWTFEGNHDLSTVTNSGGIGGSPCLHLRAASRSDYLGSRVRTEWATALSSGTPATLRAKVRWLRGCPEILLRLRGNTIEATGPLLFPADLGTPGRANSVAMVNAGPAIADMTHSPVLPTNNEAIVVTALVADPHGISSVQLNYRIDPSATLNPVTMNDAGTGGDAVAGDGVFSGIIPGQTTGTLVAFHVRASDPLTAQNIFPKDAPTRECLVRFGEVRPSGGFGTYRLWMTAATVSTWSTRSVANINNRPLDLTFVYNDQRVIYNAGGAYNGSDNTSEGYNSPAGKLCGYTLQFSSDDLFLGTDEAVLDWPFRDSTAQREQLTYWMANEVGLPFNHRRFVRLHVNGVRETQRTPQVAGSDTLLYEDIQTPSGDFVKQWYLNRDDGDLYKLQLWRRDYKFPARPSPNNETYHAALENHIDAAGRKHLARYRWNWRKRATSGSANDYSGFFDLIDAASIANTASFVAAMNAVADTEQWMRILAFERCIGNFDSWGNRNGHNAYAYRPNDGGRWQILTFDNDLVFGSTSEGTSDNLFGTYNPTGVPGVGSPDPVVVRMRNTPAFQRAYWRGFRDFVNGPMLSANYLPYANSQQAALAANAVSVSGPSQFSGWIDARRSYIVGQLSAVSPAFAVNFPASVFNTNRNTLTLTGTAPIDVKTVLVNGVERVVTWTGVTAWSLVLALEQGMNTLQITGVDLRSQPVSGASRTITVNVTTMPDAPETSLVINEIMYHPAVTNAGFVEILNRSTTTSFDLSGWRITGVNFSFAEGTVIAPLGFLVVASDPIAFGRAYGFTIPLAGEHHGVLANAGDTLSLLRVAGTNETWIDTVTYEGALPWPVNANGGGPSLQLIDAAQDNDRVANWAAAIATPGAVNSVVTLLTPIPLLWINEVQPNNLSGPTDNAGEREPWVEIYNAGSGPLSLNGFYLSDNFTNLARWAFPPGSSLAPGAFQLVWLDGHAGQTTSADWHAGFRADPTHGTLAIVSVLNGRTSVVDHLSYQFAAPDLSFGSFPEGNPASRRWFFLPTPGTTNDPSAAPAVIRINEWMAVNTTLPDASFGGFPDWFELFNTATVPVDLAGWTLSDNLLNPARFIIPLDVTIGPRSFLLAWADDRTAFTNGDLHVNFKLDRDGDVIGLFDPRGTLVDSVAFGPQTNDVSQGRWPNGGSGPLAWMPASTPRASNVIPVAPEIEILSLIETVPLQYTLTWTAVPGLSYRVQHTENLGGAWTDLPGDVVASSGMAMKTDALGTLPRQRFYRVIAVGGWDP